MGNAYWGYKKKIRSVEDIKDNSKARIQIRIPVWGAKEYLELSGQVIWCSCEGKDEELGIQFLSSDNKGNEALVSQLRTMNK